MGKTKLRAGIASIALAAAGWHSAAPAFTKVTDDWPRDASGALIAGNVDVLAEVASDGHVIDVRLFRSSANRALDDKALATVRAYTFKPFSSDPNATPRWAHIPVRFDPNVKH